MSFSPRDTIVVVQVRSDSTRLASKCFLPMIGGMSVLEFQTRRLSESDLPVIIATTDRVVDDGIEELGTMLGMPVFRGSATDVSARLVATADYFGASGFVRVCGDDPLVDPMIVNEGVRLFEASGVDLVLTAFDEGLAYGCAFEIFSSEKLRQLLSTKKGRSVCEPVSPRNVFVSQIENVRSLFACPDPSLRRPEYALTMDYLEDYQILRTICEALYFQYGISFSYEEIIHYCDSNQNLALSNRSLHPSKFDLSYAAVESSNSSCVSLLC